MNSELNMESSAEDFINGLSAHMSRLEVDEYISGHETLISGVERIEKAVREFGVPSSEEDFLRGRRLKSMLSSLSCYVFNNKKGDELIDRVANLECELGGKLATFARRLCRKVPKDIKPLVRYVLWSRYYTREDRESIAVALTGAGVLYRKEKAYLVTGLHLAVGDNMFGIDRNGREYRKYVMTCLPQAFYVSGHWQEIFENLSVEAPELDEDLYCPTGIGDRKYCAKISFSWKDKNFIRGNYLRR